MFNKFESGDNVYYIKETEAPMKQDTIDAGVYVGGLWNAGLSSFPCLISPKKIDPLNGSSGIIKFTHGVNAEVHGIVKEFLSEESKEIHKSLKVTHKLGMLLYGPPGTGKTTLAYTILEECSQKYNAISIQASSLEVAQVARLLNDIRTVTNKLIIVFMDEMECDHENSLLNFLDGTNSVNNMIYIGATNYIDKVADRIKYRPSRIRHLFEIDRMPPEVYKQYYLEKVQELPKKFSLPKESEDALLYHAYEDKLTIDEFKHTIVSMLLYKLPYKDAKYQAPKEQEELEEED